ncbi:MAG: hypothetical protein QM831_06475 [Kofleriaceae bacterium]
MKRFILFVAACGSSHHPFPNADPMTKDTDMRDVSVACRSDPSKDDPKHMNCAPEEYISPFIWDQVDNIGFARVSRGLSITVSGEARNVNAFDEVPDSSWFTNKPRDEHTRDDAPGACKAADMLPSPDQVQPGEWVIDHGKDNGSTLGFRINIKGKGKFMLKADDEGLPERASAASVIGAAIYDEVGYYTSCEQVTFFKKEQLKLTPGLKVILNSGVSHPFDEEALDKAIKSTTHMPDGSIRMQASKWLPGQTIGPFRYIGTREDDPNDVIPHEDRRELRGGRILAAWLDHWDAREQNSMDVWFAANEKAKDSSPGHVVHYYLDTSDTMGGAVGIDDASRRLGHSYNFDFLDVGRSIITFGIEEYPWDRAVKLEGKEKFQYYSTRDFVPGDWKPFYPNPAFLRMTERDAAWMARKLARFKHEDIVRLVQLGKWQKPGDERFLTNTLEVRLQRIFERYFSRISPLGELRMADGKICATDFARLTNSFPGQYRYVAREHGKELVIQSGDDGSVCITRPPAASTPTPITIRVRNGTRAGALVIHAFDEGKEIRLVGVDRPED